MKLAVVVGSTRGVRKTLQQAKWVLNNAKNLPDTTVELLDLADYPMPFFDEPASPRYNPDRKLDPTAKKWLDKLAEYDAYVFVTAEYNHSVPGVLKNALDYIDFQLVHKPAFVVSHGSAGGARAMTDLKEILSESKAVVTPVGPLLAVVHMAEQIDEDGNLTEAGQANAYLQANLKEALEDLKWYSDALSAARAQTK